MRIISVLGLTLLLTSGCAGLDGGREPPTVSVQSFRAVASSGAAVPGFEVDLLILNPDPQALRLRGIAYSIDLGGQSLLQGVHNELPEIEGYGQASVTLNAAVDVLGGIRLLSSLMSETRNGLDYEFRARLDPAGFSRDIRLSQSGRIDLSTRIR
jgi:hypothetical protein